jgi:UDP-N-acetylglucosamine 4-epimerase
LVTGKKENIAPFLTHPNFEFIEGDLRDFQTCEHVIKGIDLVFHHAALGSVPRSVENPILTNAHNVTGFLNILEAAKSEGVERFVYATSSSTYGDLPDLPKVENVQGKPLSPYAVTKSINEMYAQVYADLYGIKTIGLRYFNVFGKRQDPNGAYAAVIPRFIKKIVNDEPIMVHGDGEQIRDFTSIENVIQANKLAATTENPNALNTVYNIAYGSQISINQLIDLMAIAIMKSNPDGKKIKVIYSEKRQGEIVNSYASIEKAKELLGYLPEVSLREGLERYLSQLKFNESIIK